MGNFDGKKGGAYIRKINLLLTDPPYNIAYEGSNGLKILNDNMDSNKFLIFLTDAFQSVYDLMENGAAFYVWHSAKEQANFEKALNNAGLEIRQQLIWNKNSFILGRQDYQWKHEPCFYGWKEGAAHYFVNNRTFTTVIEDAPNINKMSKDELKIYVKELLKRTPPTTIIDEDKPTINDVHPTMKPLKLIGYQISNSTKKGDVVADIFGGSGSTLIACEQLDRICYTMELDPKYCDVIIKRWEQYTGQTAELIT